MTFTPQTKAHLRPAMTRLQKLLRLAANPQYWRFLARGVAPSVEHRGPLRSLQPATVIDVGANKGQFSAFAAVNWRASELIAFEPLPAPRTTYTALLGRRATMFPYAAGAAEATAEIRVASRDDSSSLLPLGSRQKTLFHMDEVGVETVVVRPLDDCLDGEALKSPVLLKIDVQGFELEVLKGAVRILKNVSAVYVECSYVELYEGQAIAHEIITFLETHGFSQAGEFNLMSDAKGLAIQADLLFLRSNS